jgi:FlaA1/EpsC-like NDP-sugar epimerase
MRLVQQVVDLVVLIIAFQAAYLLRFEFAIPPQVRADALMQLPYVVLLQSLALYVAGVQTFIWRYIGMADMKAFLVAAGVSVVPMILLRLFTPETWPAWRIPFSVIVIDTAIAFGGILAVRVIRRVLYEHQDHRSTTDRRVRTARKPVLLIGAGRAGNLAAREIQSRGNTDLQIAGFIDDNPNKVRSVIQGIKVLGTTNDLPALVPAHRIDHVIITIDELSRHDLKRIRDICDAVPVKVRIVPTLSEILQGKLSFSRVRDVQIEDLLGRAPVQLDPADMERLVSGRTVMVTGAGGSIGSELARQVARFCPSTLLLVERAEFALFNIERELRELRPELRIEPLLADVGVESRMRKIFEEYRPNVVLHAAAHKHVPMLEHNPFEGISNNVFGTQVLGRLAGASGVEVFVLISTDKAVCPTSIMGVSKRLTELVIQALGRSFDTRFVAVRFGNVIGSAGSVIPLFREQINKGGPVVVTHPDMVRYFMTIPEASQLVLQAAAMGQGGEIFVLDMGEPVRILDLAKETIRLSGLKPYEDIDIVFSGVRPGEKLFEELGLTDEQIAKTRHPKIFIGQIASYSDETIAQILEQLTFLAREGDVDRLREYLNQVVSEARLKVSNEQERGQLRTARATLRRSSTGALNTAAESGAR